MRRSGFFSRLKTTFLGTAVFALFSFGFQSIALPIHASSHELRRIVQTAPSILGHAVSATHSTRIVESDCELCDLATHQAVQSASFVTFTVIDSIALREVLPHSETLLVRPALLPPARGPPARV